MQEKSLVNTIILVIIIILILAGFYFLFTKLIFKTSIQNIDPVATTTIKEEVAAPVVLDEVVAPVAEKPVVSFVLPAPYISAQTVWPPVVEEMPTPYNCEVSINGMGVQTVTSLKDIGGKSFCTILTSEGAMGTIYKTYTYITMGDQRPKTTTFTLAFSDSDGCNGHGTPEENICQKAQSDFNIDNIIEALFSK